MKTDEASSNLKNVEKKRFKSNSNELEYWIILQLKTSYQQVGC